jgi:hypothetical protein
LGEDSILLRDTPIQLRWESKSPAKLVDDKVLNRSSPEKKKTVVERSPWDPHRVGFGPIPRKVMQIPPVNGDSGILGEMPSGKTRGVSWVGEGGERHHGGDDVGGVPPPPPAESAVGESIRPTPHSVAAGRKT